MFLGSKQLERKGPLIFSDRQVIVSANSFPEYYWYNSPKHYPVKSVIQKHPDNKGYTMEIGIPMDAIGIEPEKGMAFRLDIGIDESDDGPRRQRQLMWSGSENNSIDREYWGIATLVD